MLELQADLRVLTHLSGDAGSNLDSALTALQTVSDELAQLYHHVCAVIGETPNRVLLAHQKKDLPSRNGVGPLELLQARLQTDIPIKNLESLQDAASMAQQVDTVLDQVRHLRASVEHSLETTKSKPRAKQEFNPDGTFYFIFYLKCTAVACY